jgi:hypothetical protein
VQKTLEDPGHLAKMPEISAVAVNLDGATTDHGHDHGGFSEHETRHGSLPFFQL